MNLFRAYGRSIASNAQKIARRGIFCPEERFILASNSSVRSYPHQLKQIKTTCARFLSNDARQGLYSIPELLEPSDFSKTAQQAMESCDSLCSSFDTPPTPKTRQQAVDVLYRLDEISRVVCNVIDAAELCRSSHIDESWRMAANQAFTILSDYIAQLNANVNLFQALKNITGQPTLLRELSDEEQRFALLLQTEFERDGIHFSDDTRQHVRQVQNSIVQLEGEFHRNMVHFQRNFGALRSDVEDVMPSQVLEQVFGINSQSDSTIELTNNQQLLQTLLKYSPSPSLRKQVYMEHSTAVPENLDVLLELRIQRHNLARTLGYESYAERVLSDNKMARSTSDVAKFLTNLSAQNEPIYKKEMALMTRAKEQLEGGGAVEPWDVSYLSGLLKAQLGYDSQQVSQFLTLSRCLESIKILCRELFDIIMVENEIAGQDRWDGTTSKEDHRVRCFSFQEEATGRSLGTMYLDLHPREGKYGHAAHFTVRCGCVVNGLGSTTGDDREVEYQLPVVALVCNLSSGGTSEGPGMLSHGDVETLFHEMGHALHSLLSRTSFQHVSGTRAAMDFVETPSHLFENYVWDPNFLKILAVNTRTGEPISDELITKLEQSRNQLQAVERRTQILYAMFDQQLFGMPMGSEETMFSRNASTDIFANLHKSMGIPFAEGTHWHSRFGHLVSYGAGYYSYLYAQEFAKSIWDQKLKGKSLNKDSGREIWHKFLIHGGAKDPQLMLQDLLG
mmetsp:Transcript_19214/g.24734  ORF Transcript_19214/g.24734 Transcript_19214/m.24734 type:complete len:733 (+) Transcript_19214:91-2289(+)|eukprot:CAMPEP_0198146566 /NCGR_PEP_ID=MMETSP1443-20131203/29940_1 /TAXON_ID=186043 /ORGANISM="Entomoneis sp., Strain CCMP2396" /LENGTH=732 /DNA_ID=CAMNT_0043810569 /DNA_START=53 /DNA_END=2251 /DNA_ORIENTATION=-